MIEQTEINPYRRILPANSKPILHIGRQIILKCLLYCLKKEFWLMGGTAFLLARAQILGGLYPFAVAFIAAKALEQKETSLYAFLGACLAAPFTFQGLALWSQLGIYVILTMLVYFYPARTRKILLYPILAGAINFVVKGTGIAFLDNNAYNIMVILFESLLVAGLTPVLYVALRSWPWSKEEKYLSVEEYICFLLFIMFLIMGVGDLSYKYISLRGIISKYCILSAAWLGGPGGGAAVGVLIGIVPSLSTLVRPETAGSFAFSGMLAGTFKTFNKLGIIIGFMLANLLLSIYYINQPEVLGSFAEGIGAILFFIITPRQFFDSFRELNIDGKADLHNKEEIPLQEMLSERLNKAAVIFNDLSSSFSHAATMEKKEVEELNKLFGMVRRQVCQDCAIYKICWEFDNANACKSILELFRLFDQKGFINIKLLNVDIKKRCPRMREMVTAVSCLYENYRLNEYWENKFSENRELLAAQMRGMSGIMEKLADEVDSNIKTKQKMQHNLANELEKLGLSVTKISVQVCSKNNVEISFTKEVCHGLHNCPRVLAKAVSNIFAKEFIVVEANCALQTETCQCSFKLLPKGCLRVSCAARQVVKHGNSINGDSVQSKMLKNGKQLFLVSDGMGCGPVAALESQTTVKLLEGLLETGFDKETALKTVNAILLARQRNDSFATVDLAVFDSFSGESDFVKVAAPPSFIKRNNKVTSIKAQNLPIGIIHNLDIETKHEKLKANDYLIMVTDGVLDVLPVYNKEEWLSQRLQEIEPQSPDDLADKILKRVVATAKGKICDDMTVFVAYIY